MAGQGQSGVRGQDPSVRCCMPLPVSLHRHLLTIRAPCSIRAV